MNFFKNVFLMIVISLIASIRMIGQDAEYKMPIEFYLGGSYTIAPSFSIDGNWTINATTSASFYSLFGDLVINKNLIGRVQVSFLSSLSDELDSELISGFEMNGSLGYNLKLENNEKLSIPIMATIGYASIADESAKDPGMQLGVTMGLNYALAERVNATSTIRYLKGVGFESGAKISQLDLSFGVQYRIL